MYNSNEDKLYSTIVYREAFTGNRTERRNQTRIVGVAEQTITEWHTEKAVNNREPQVKGWSRKG